MSDPPTRYFAHSEPARGGEWEPLAEHAQLVADRASRYAAVFGASDEARAAGLLHDAGKATELFERRLRNEVSGLDHWTPGAALALQRYKQHGIAAALAIEGHHVGLASAGAEALRKIGRLTGPWERTLTSEDPEELARRLGSEGLELPDLDASVFEMSDPHASSLLDIRMLFSCLVDADFLETEAHFDRDDQSRRRYREDAPKLRATRAIELVKRRVRDLTEQNRNRSSEAVQRLRSDLFRSCIRAAEEPPGIFNLSAPTGAGKTLSMLAFAMRHARIHGMRRVVMAAPYLSILDQTAKEYRELLEPEFGRDYVLEHHSLAGTRGGEPESDEQERAEALRRRQALSWDAPLIVTTNVQLLESLFAHRPRACRKLHRMAGSVLLFDEVQTLPSALAVSTLAVLSHLVERYGVSVVFSTATQPAFEHLESKVRSWTTGGWSPRDVAPRDLNLFARLDRVEVDWRTGTLSNGTWQRAAPLSWDELVEELADKDQFLCVLNLKRHTLEVMERLKEKGIDGLFHLSTSMCPAHRLSVLDEVKQRLKDGQVCRLVSTQCVEAGVDVDFPWLYRAFGPLDALAQAAGRCNRNGTKTEKGRMVIFRPEGAERDLYPSGEYRFAAKITEEVLRTRAEAGETWDLQDPDLFDYWYRRLFSASGVGNEVKRREERLHKALKARNFGDVASAYRLIPKDTVQVVVPWDPDRFAALQQDSEGSEWIRAEWMRKAQAHSVSLYCSQKRKYRNMLIPAPLGARLSEHRSEDWYFLNDETLYDPTTGLREPKGSLIV